MIDNRKRASKRRGAALVETAIVLPVLLFVTFGAIEFGSVFYVKHNMVQAARVAARTVAVQDGTIAQAQAAAQAQLDNMPSITFSITITEPAPGDDTNRDVVVRIEAPLSEAALDDPLSILDDLTLEAQVIMRKEG